MTEEQMKEIKERSGKHGDLLLLTAPNGAELVVRRPTRMEWRRFQHQATEDGRGAEASEAVLTSCTVWPEGAELKAMFDLEPGLVQTFLRGLVEFAGASAKVEKKAL